MIARLIDTSRKRKRGKGRFLRLRFRLVSSAATALLLVLFVRAGLAQQSPPPSPFSGTRTDPYYQPPAPGPNQPGLGQRFPIVNQPPPVPRLGFSDEAVEAPVTPVGGTIVEPQPPSIGQPPSEVYQPGRIVAQVGDQVILYGDVASMADQALASTAARVTNKYQQEEFNALREQVIMQFTQQLVETKLRYLEFRRTIAKNAKDKVQEAEKGIEESVRKAFDNGLAEMRKKLEAATPKDEQELMKQDIVLPRLALVMKENNLETMAQLDEMLRRYGSSLDKQRVLFREHNLGNQTIVKKLSEYTFEVTQDEMVAYYKSHGDKYKVPSRARFEILTVQFSKFPDRASAWKQLAEMGNAVFLGKPFAEVAKQLSQEPNASKGGKYDWTDKGALVSEVIDQAIFELPENKLSRILEDGVGYHILRVTERQEATTIPFTEAQKEIKETLKREKREAKITELLAQLRKSTPTWTIYDQGTVANQPPPPGQSTR